MRRTDLVNGLVARGYKAEVTEKVKNGVIFEGIIISDENPVAPVIYTEKLIAQAEQEGKSIGEVVDEILRIYEEGKNSLEFDLQNLYDREWVLEHLSIGLQKESDQDLIKKSVEEMEGIEAYLYLKDRSNGEGNYEIKLSQEHLKSLKIFEAEAWEYAYEHICKETTLISMEELMAEMVGMPVDENVDSMMYVISNEERVKGASCILNKEALKEFAQKKGVNQIYVLPSSLHDMILVPDNGEFSMQDLSEMVKEVNDTQVDPEEQLPSRAYLLQF